METVFQTLGVVAIAVGLVVVLGGAFLVWKVKRFLRNLASGLASAVPPDTIALRPNASPKWKERKKVDAHLAQLRQRGFASAGTFDIPALGGVLLAGFVKPSDGALAVVYEHPRAGVIVDLVTYYPDGTGVTVTSSAPTGLDVRPGFTRVNLPGSDASALYARLQKERAAGRTPTAVKAGEFAARFEKAYADEMAWRNSRGGPTEDEIRNVAAQSGRTLSDEEMAEAKARLRKEA